jgi:adenylyltransferase/sulfurtransferase
MPSEDLLRYSRQTILPEIGIEGQKRLGDTRCLVVGCGALGSMSSEHLVRAGVGHITIIDRDIVELENLQRQILFSESDIGITKATAAQEHLKAINSTIEIEGLVQDLNPRNASSIIQDMDVVVDGTDNMETRYLINDVCVKEKIPWVYGGAVSTYGMSMNVIPEDTACLICAFPHLPKPGSLPTCDTVGVVNTIPSIVASIQATEALKILLKRDFSRHLLIFDVWSHDFEQIKITRKDDCPCCVKRNFNHMDTDQMDLVTTLCGRNAVQISPVGASEISLEQLAERLEKVGRVELGPVHLMFQGEGVEISVFSDGRAIVKGTDNISTAKSLYAKYIGK